jgi:hypothetical protein
MIVRKWGQPQKPNQVPVEYDREEVRIATKAQSDTCRIWSWGTEGSHKKMSIRQLRKTSLLNENFSSVEHTASNYRTWEITSRLLKGTVCGMKQTTPNLRYYSCTCLDGLRKITRAVVKVSVLWPIFERATGVLINRLPCSVLTYSVHCLFKDAVCSGECEA